MRNTPRHPARRDVASDVGSGIAIPAAAPIAVTSGVRVRKPSRAKRTRRRGHARADVILFLAANPQGSHLLRLSEECAAIQRELRMTRHRDDVRFESRWAVSVDDLMRHLIELDPAVIHFSGHGGGGACLMLQDEAGQPQPVSARALALIILAAARNARVVVLNACDSAAQAEVLVAVVDCVVSMDGAIGDDAARAFAIRFYGAIGNGRSIDNAVAHGVAALAAKQQPDEVLPRCLTRGGVDAGDVFVGRASARRGARP
jgi:hypothetical protein